MHFTTTYLWEKGNRQINQDSIAILSLEINNIPVLLAIVADGIGGLNEGETASCYTVSFLKNKFYDHICRNSDSHALRISRLRKLMMRGIYRVHRRLKEYGCQKGITLGTTCSIVCLVGKRGFIIHIGDSTVLRNSRPLTHRHSDHHGRLLNAIGCGNRARIYSSHFFVTCGDEILLATDGYFKLNNSDNIAAIRINITKEK